MYDFWTEWLPLVNTALIVVSGLFLIAGYILIRQRRIAWHRRAMLTATVFAGLFLVVYVTRFLIFPTKVFTGDSTVRVIYLVILASHVVLAIALGPMVLVTLRRALRSQFRQHRRIARITLPVWLYVVVTGWLIYWMLHTF